jgi:2-polyprenyl-3-methyl-5-hydroxy-6-metoxy-1,4-benzoquinol methylase
MADQTDIPMIVAALVGEVVKEFPVHRGFLERALDEATSDELRRLDDYLGFCLGRGLEMSYLARSYLTIVEDTLEEQFFFNRAGHYRHSTFAEVADRVYHDREYMDRYMYGLAISTFLWPNHVAMARFFRSTIPRDRGGRYLEVGPGHGYLFLMAMELASYDEFHGVDLSEASIHQTKAIVEHFQPGRPVTLELRDFLAADSLEVGTYDAIVMGEVLEHVERPGAFLRRIRELASPGAFIFVTTCVNAPAVDHIYLWRSTDELESLISECGLRVVTPLRLPYEGKTLDESIAAALPINVAYVLAADGVSSPASSP